MTREQEGLRLLVAFLTAFVFVMLTRPKPVSYDPCEFQGCEQPYNSTVD